MTSTSRSHTTPVLSTVARGAASSSSGLTSRRHVDYGRVRSAICQAR